MSFGNPYMNGYPMQAPVYQPPMQDRLAQLQNQYQQTVPQGFNNMQAVQPMHLNGQVVDSIDVVKAKDVDMTGAVTYYPKADLTEIYTKQLQPNGMSRIVTYKAIPEETPEPATRPVTMDTINDLISQLRSDVLQEISGVKELVESITVPVEQPAPKTTRGGSKS